MNKKTLTLLFVYVLAAVSVVTYYPSLLNNSISWNDPELFGAVSLFLKGKIGLFARPEYPPLYFAFLAFQRSFSEYGYFLFHALSVVAHALNAILLYFIARRLFASERIAIIVSALFAVHPVAVGTVAWLSGQSTVFSTLFLFVTCLSYLRFKESGKAAGWWLTLACSAVFYSIASPALNLILILLGIDMLRDSRFGWKQVFAKGPIFIVWIIALVMRLRFSGSSSYLVQLAYDSAAMIRLGITEIILRSAFPWHDALAASADDIALRSSVYGESVYPLIFLVLLALVIWKRKSTPVVFIGFSFLVVTSLPLFTGRAWGNWVLLDRSFYLSVAGIYLAAAGVIEEGYRALKGRAKAEWMLHIVIGCILLGLLYDSRERAVAWKDSVTFWGKALEENPASTFVLTERGMYHFSRYEIAPALSDLSMVVRMAPEEPQSYINRGVVRLDAYDYSDAISDFAEALRLRPGDSKASYDLGLALAGSSMLDSAEAAFSRAIDADPGFAQAYEARAGALARTGKYVLAFADYQRALELDPEYAEAYGNRAFAFLQTGNFGRGLADFATQLRLAPYKVDARIHYGYTALMVGDTVTALRAFTEALRADSTNGKTYLLGVSKVFLKSEEDQRRGEQLFHRLGIK